jgi:hypothetical protein
LRNRPRNQRIPSENEYRAIDDGGLYPAIEDPQFISRLLRKTEFAETKSDDFDPNSNPCEGGPEFELTPVQEFVSNFMSPRTPYMSCLLYHGVGVGKTATAIASAEAYLDMFPRRKVFIVCPRAIRSGFKRTIFDPKGVTIGQGDAANVARGPTGDTYLRLSGCLYERDLELIKRRVDRVINRRYDFFGYGQFANYIRNVKQRIPAEAANARVQVAAAFKKEFNYRFLIIDEAHNLRDVSGMATLQRQPEEIDTVGDVDDSKGAKELTPFLKELLQTADGIKLLLMTATPMFNSVFEIQFLFNLMLMNEKKPLVSMEELLNADGSPAEGSAPIFKRLANAYVSFMRGENPNSFPLRLYPEGEDPIGERVSRLTEANYPTYRLGKILTAPVGTLSKQQMSKLPIVTSQVDGEDSPYNRILTRLTRDKVRAGGVGYQVIDSLLQAGNCVFPHDEDMDESRADSYVGMTGYDEMFTKEGKGAVRAKDAKWLIEENLRNYSPKLATILRYIQGSKGVEFVYSRFVSTGAFLLALALEANGYTPYGRDSGYLKNGIQDGHGRQCALCPLREDAHRGAGHGFVPAKYVLLTGDTASTNAESIEAARDLSNKDGRSIKVVIGSQIAGEGVDLRFIREVHVLDAWFHLNKTEQIVGRGIRYCSHSALPLAERNTTIFLHAVAFPRGKATFETADLYCYRTALQKAIQVGVISRMLKHYAVDCNLRKNVVFLMNPNWYRRHVVDAQGLERESAPLSDGTQPGVPLRDMDYTAICDWMECPRDFGCGDDGDQNIDISLLKDTDDSTYDSFSTRFTESKMKRILQALFSQKPYYLYDILECILVKEGSFPLSAVRLTLQTIVNNRTFRLHSGGQDGYLIYKNGYVLFQPDAYRDLKIPMALRIAMFPVKRDEYEPETLRKEDYAQIDEAVAEETKAAEEDDGQSANIWHILMDWLENVMNGSVKGIPSEVEAEVERFAGTNKALRDFYYDKLHTILFLQTKIQNKKLFEEAALEYIWDEWIPRMIQIRMIQSNDPTVREVAKEQILSSGAERIIRTINYDTNRLEYLCSDGRPCSKGVIEAFEEEGSDPIQSRSAKVGQAGRLYGFMVPKRGKIVFKTLTPHKEGAKPDRGQECEIITTPSHYIDKLVEIGTAYTEAGQPNLDLDRAHLATSTNIINTRRGCAMLDLILRYTDKVRLGGRRWFFRPISSYWSGHRGVKSAAVKSQETAAERALQAMEQAAATAAKPKTKLKVVRKPTANAPAPTALPKLTVRRPTAAPIAPAAPVPEAEEVVPAAVPTARPKITVRRPTAAPVVAPAPVPEVEEEEVVPAVRPKLTVRRPTAAPAPAAPMPEPEAEAPAPVPAVKQSLKDRLAKIKAKTAAKKATEAAEPEEEAEQPVPLPAAARAALSPIDEAPFPEIIESPEVLAPLTGAPAPEIVESPEILTPPAAPVAAPAPAPVAAPAPVVESPNNTLIPTAAAPRPVSARPPLSAARGPTLLRGMPSTRGRAVVRTVKQSANLDVNI